MGGQLCLTIGTVSYVAVACLAMQGKMIAALPILMVLSRFIQGFGQGVTCQQFIQMVGTFCPCEHRSTWMIASSLTIHLGIGLGPLLASVVNAAARISVSGADATVQFQMSACFQVAATLGALAFIWAAHPRLEKTSTLQSSDEVDNDVGERDQRRWIVF